MNRETPGKKLPADSARTSVNTTAGTSQASGPRNGVPETVPDGSSDGVVNVSTSSGPPALDVRELTVRYRGRHKESPAALDSVSFDVAPGEFVALVGESGSGKSTLASAVLGFLPDTATVERGDISLTGRSMTRASRDAQVRYRGRLVSYIPQDPGSSLTPTRTIGAQIFEAVRVGAGSRRGSALSRTELEDLAVSALESVGIHEAGQRLRQFPHELSGGMRQRVLIAMAFAMSPRLIVADEPTSALDVTVQRQVMDLLHRKARDSGTAVLFITHDLALGSDYADRVLVLKGGRLVGDLDISSVLRGQLEGYPAELFAEAYDREAGHTATVRSRTVDTDSPSSRSAPVVVRFDGVTKRFRTPGGDLTALDDIGFEIHRGEVLGLVGESGSGKSTIANLLLGLEQPDEGNITVLGRDGYRDGTADSSRGTDIRWERIQIVSQNPDSWLDPLWRVGRSIAEPLSVRREGSRASRRRRAGELLDRVGLSPEVIDRRPGELSGGQRQRVAIARAVAVRAPILILDEALSALDVLTRRGILDLLEEIRETSDLTFLFISHDLSVVRRIADRVVVLQGGQIREEGPTSEVLSKPSCEYTRQLLDAEPGRRLRKTVG